MLYISQRDGGDIREGALMETPRMSMHVTVALTSEVLS